MDDRFFKVTDMMCGFPRTQAVPVKRVKACTNLRVGSRRSASINRRASSATFCVVQILPAARCWVPGTYLVYFSTNNVRSDLPAKRFNEYASAEGLSQVLAQRAATDALNKPGRELYSRRGKAIIQIGSANNVTQPHITRPVGLGLEIVPLSNPYAGGKSSEIIVQVLYQGQPLPGALVKLNNLAADAQPVEMHRSDATGRAAFQARRIGQWQFNVVWSQPLTNNPTADFLTTFSSLTFGFPAVRPAR